MEYIEGCITRQGALEDVPEGDEPLPGYPRDEGKRAR
jgi:hypothetical protein